jgi:hypothetical protein
MEITPSSLSTLSTLLLHSLSPLPSVRHPAEKQLAHAETQEGFLLLVLALVGGGGGGGHAGGEVEVQVRQAAAVYFKNVVKRRWREVSVRDRDTDTDRESGRRSEKYV